MEVPFEFLSFTRGVSLFSSLTILTKQQGDQKVDELYTLVFGQCSRFDESQVIFIVDFRVISHHQAPGAFDACTDWEQENGVWTSECALEVPGTIIEYNLALRAVVTDGKLQSLDSTNTVFGNKVAAFSLTITDRDSDAPDFDDFEVPSECKQTKDMRRGFLKKVGKGLVFFAIYVVLTLQL